MYILKSDFAWITNRKTTNLAPPPSFSQWPRCLGNVSLPWGRDFRVLFYWLIIKNFWWENQSTGTNGLVAWEGEYSTSRVGGGIFLMVASAMYRAEEPSQRKTFSKKWNPLHELYALFWGSQLFFLIFLTRSENMSELRQKACRSEWSHEWAGTDNGNLVANTERG